MGIGLSTTTILVWFCVVFVIPCIYIAYTLNYKRKLYSVYEHFLAIGIIKTSLDYAYDEVKEWYVPRDSFNETFVTALYKQIKSDYCNTFSGKDSIYIEEILNFIILLSVMKNGTLLPSAKALRMIVTKFLIDISMMLWLLKH